MIPLSSFIVVLCALAGVVAACYAIGQACFRRHRDGAATQLALLWSAVSVALTIVMPALDGFRASGTAALASILLLATAALLAFFLGHQWREAAMEREVQRIRLQRAESADAKTADPDLETLCAKAARRYDLTRREEDVLRLLVEGRTAPQIAEDLVVSPNTVKTHVRHLYKKLGITRRDDLASRLKG